MSRTFIEAIGVTKKFDEQVVVDDVSLSVAEGDVVCIIGPSGGGKSTFLRCLNQLERLDAGLVYVDSELMGYRDDASVTLRALPTREIARQRRKLGIVFQNFNLFSHMTVLQNIMEAPVGVLKKPKPEAREHAMELLRLVNLPSKANSYPSELSGGQQQRVAIARALAMEPQAILFDEPTSALDPELVQEVLSVIKSLAQNGVTMVIVTHELTFASGVANRIVFMDEGRIVEEGPAQDVLMRPQHERTKRFLSQVLSQEPPRP